MTVIIAYQYTVRYNTHELLQLHIMYEIMIKEI